jgi:hypothetical protein
MDRFQRFVQSDCSQEKFADYCIERVNRLMRYTLCVFQGCQRWNSFRNDFAVLRGIESEVARAARPAFTYLLICCHFTYFYIRQFSAAGVRHGSI